MFISLRLDGSYIKCTFNFTRNFQTVFLSGLPDFYEDGTEQEKGSLGSKCKAKALKTQKTVPKGVQSHKNNEGPAPSLSPTSSSPRHCGAKGSASHLRRASLREPSLTICYHQVPPIVKLAMKIKVTLVFTMDIKANKRQIEQDVKKFYKLTSQSQHTNCISWPEEGMHSIPDYNALESSRKIEII